MVTQLPGLYVLTVFIMTLLLSIGQKWYFAKGERFDVRYLYPTAMALLASLATGSVQGIDPAASAADQVISGVLAAAGWWFLTHTGQKVKAQIEEQL